MAKYDKNGDVIMAVGKGGEVEPIKRKRYKRPKCKEDCLNFSSFGGFSPCRSCIRYFNYRDNYRKG